MTPPLKVGGKGILHDLYWAFALKVREYWEPHELAWTLIVGLGIVMVLAMILGVYTPWKLPVEGPPPVDATPYPEQTPCPPPWAVC